MATPRHVYEGDQSVTFVELFFDLVFVYSVTQVVSLLMHGHGPEVIGQAVLVFWLIWWAWTQFSWALNAADTEHPLVEAAVLVATVVVFFMAIALPEAFGAQAAVFAGCYVLVRAIGLTVYAWVVAHDAAQRRAVRRFSALSLLGLGSVLAGGLLGGDWIAPLWAAAVVLDVLAALFAGRAEGWNLRPGHFGERHGLFIIIALGETLIAAAHSVGEGEWTALLLTAAVLAAAIACTLWWTYFARARPLLEAEFKCREGVARSRLARDVYSLLHFPLICGIVAFAVAFEGALAHPHEPLTIESRAALAAGVVLFIGGMALALWRAVGRFPGIRVTIAGSTAAVVLLLPDIPSTAALGVALAGSLTVAVVEQRSGCYRQRLASHAARRGMR